MLISIDPGLRGCGAALWSDTGELLSAEYLKGSDVLQSALAWKAMASTVKVWVAAFAPDAKCLAIELPRTYGGRAAKGDANDLIQLAAVVGGIVTRLGLETVVYLPDHWKGQCPKSVTKERVDAKLSDAEKARIAWPAASLRHNVIDGIGIGLHHLRR